jgi:multicomponent Na+:H+ antiporter subunit D
MAQMAQRITLAPPGVGALLAGLLLVAYSSKAGLFPLFFWLPASYHTPHPAITAFFGGLLTKVGIYTLFRIFPLIFPMYLIEWQPLILTIAGLTMITGVFGAMAVHTLRRVLSFHVISQVGYMVMGLGLAATGDPVLAGFGMAAGILYLVHHMIVKTALLMAGGAAELEMGSGILASNQLNGLVGRRPILAVIFFVAAFSLAGIPPSSGFISKLGLLQNALTGQHWWIAGVSLLVSLFTLMSMVRLWQNAFTGHATQPIYPTAPLTRVSKRWLTLAPIGALVILSLSIGLFSGPVFRWSSIAANQVLDRAGYIAAVAPTDEITIIEHK